MIHLVNKISGGILILIFGGILVLTGFPRAFGVEPMIVKSGSMEPVISTGSLTYINRRFPVEQIQIGDIIAYQAGNGVEILHRVVAIDRQNSSIRTKGDANEIWELWRLKITQERNFCPSLMWVISSVDCIRRQHGLAEPCLW